MTQVVVSRRDGTIVSILVEGHSGYASSGMDIVCSAVTTLIQALHIGLVDVLGVKVDSQVDHKKARICLTWHERSDSIQAVAATVCESFRALAETYPKNVKLVEVQRDAL